MSGVTPAIDFPYGKPAGLNELDSSCVYSHRLRSRLTRVPWSFRFALLHLQRSARPLNHRG